MCLVLYQLYFYFYIYFESVLYVTLFVILLSSNPGFATIMEFWTLGGYVLGYLKGVDIAAVITRIGADKVAGSVLSSGYF